MSQFPPDVVAAFERLMIREYAPTGAVVNETGDIICSGGPTAGMPSGNIFDIAHDTLRAEVRAALHTARVSNEIVKRDVQFEVDGCLRRLELTVRPLPGIEQDGLFAVIVQEHLGHETVAAMPPRLTDAEDRLTADLDAMTRLQKLGTLFVRERTLESVLGEIVEAAIAISGADFGNIQLIDAPRSDLRIVAHRGFPEWWLEFWNHVSKGQGVCGTALERGERVIVEDIEQSPIFVGTPALDIQRRAGVRAIQSTPLVDRAGRPLGMFSTHYRRPTRPDDRALRLLDLLARQTADIIERAEVEQRFLREREILQQLFKSVPVLLVMWDPSIRRFSLNRHTEEILGWSTAEANDGDFMSKVYPDSGYRAEAAAYMRSLEAGFREFVCRTKSGHDAPISWANISLSNDMMIGIGIDLRERKSAEDALREANARLSEADRHKNEFLAMLSHELRNPLAPIRNSLFILDRAAPGSEQARRAQAVIVRQVGHMTRLIDDLLDVTRIARGKAELQCEVLDLNELVGRTVEDHRGVFVDGGVGLESVAADAAVWVNGDRTRLSQAIGNLLVNAAKFTPRAGKTTISVAADRARKEASVCVQDTGRGIAPELQPHVFEPFIQADATIDRKKGGLGLGLALVKGLIEMHGGVVTAASPGIDQGATFKISLPLDANSSLEAQPTRSDTAKVPRRVLIIEDNEDAADSLCEALQLRGHDVEVAHDGSAGIERARAFRPDAVICDIGLPEMDGYAVARAMRAAPELQRITLVALTGYAGPEDVAKAKKAGFDAHLAKPPTMDAVERALAPREE
jgi:two-component system CheB/CheR fusion protein